MARTRQKSKQRKAKRLEQEQRGSGRSPAEDASAAVNEAATEQPALIKDPTEDQPADIAIEETAPAPAPAPSRAERSSGRTATKAPEKPRQRERSRQRPAERKQPRQRNRVINFFIQVWAELRRVQWPTRNQVTQATAVVVAFCFIAGLYLALWDFVFSRLVKNLL
jgi:preprotein translocase subunit SecE